jgi:hypothetical protein
VDGALFDPRRGGHDEHQLYNSSTGVLGAAASTGIYTESCRLIRVDGIFRVAADLYDDYMNLLETDNGASDTLSDYVPTAAATTHYQNFVLDYLEDKFVDGTTSTYNVVLDPAGDTVAGLETTYSINAPTDPILIERPTTSSGQTTEKWLHNRGLFVDYLEDEAIQAINDAKDDCAGTGTADPTDAQLRTCVLKVLPFTTINLTELTDWTPTSGDEIVVSNNDFRTALDSDTPVRGKVVPGSHPSPNQVTEAVASMRGSNSGVAVMKGPIDTDDETILSDSQEFEPDGGWDGADNDAGSGGTFQIELDNYTFPNDFNPTFSVTPTATCNPATSGTTQPNPFTCTTQYIGDDQSIRVAKYNYQINGSSSAALSCSGNNGSKTYPGSSYTTKTCRNYAVTGWTLNGTAVTGTATVTNSGTVSETTTLSIPGVDQSDVVGITFGAAVDTVQSQTCTYNGNGNNLNQYTVTTNDCP